MNQSDFRALQRVISDARLSTYTSADISSMDRIFARYIWNVKLSENFYLLLQNLEVSLRNAIYNAYRLHYPKKQFFYLFQTNSRERYQRRKEFHSRECWKMLCGVKYKLAREGTTITDGKIISELNFGFWTEMLSANHTKYTDMWRKIFIDVFPDKNIENSIDRTKSAVARRVDSIRRFRNRIFHYEPIFNHDDLDQMHMSILETIGWISNDMQRLTILFDEYDKIKSAEEEILENLLLFDKGDR